MLKGDRHCDGFKMLAQEQMVHAGVELYRVQATRDRLGGTVKAGEKGGWIQHPINLSGDAWVADESKVWGEAARVTGSALVFEESLVFDAGFVFGDARVMNSSVADRARVGGHAMVRGTIMKDSATVEGFATVTESSLHQWVTISGHADVEYSYMVADLQILGRMVVRNCVLREDGICDGELILEGIDE